jgi:hypothetical protein
MSSFTNIKMSGFTNAIIVTPEGGHYGRKGHYHYETKRFKTITCDS